MHKTHNKLLAFSALMLVAFGVYTYFSNSLSISAAETTALSSSTGGTVGAGALGTTNDQISQDTAFLATLVSLNKIKIDTSLFKHNGFQALVDNSVKSDVVTPGRNNPFAPIEATTPIPTPLGMTVLGAPLQ